MDAGMCPDTCPAPFASFDVNGADAGTLTNVQATLTGSDTETFTCEPGYKAGSNCMSRTAFATAGSYTLEVTADGFEPLSVNATVTVTTDCCVVVHMDPSEVTLIPAR